MLPESVEKKPLKRAKVKDRPIVKVPCTIEVSVQGDFWRQVDVGESLGAARERAKQALKELVPAGMRFARVRPQVTDVYVYSYDVVVKEEAVS